MWYNNFPETNNRNTRRLTVNNFPVIPGCKIESLINESPLFDVYLALQEDLDQKVIIKVLKPELAKDKNLTDLFLKEFSNATQLIHSNIASIFEAGESQGTYYIMIEYLPESLHDRIERQFGSNMMEFDLGDNLFNSPPTGEPLTGPKLHQLLRQVTSALEYSHNQGIIHKDITSENIRFRQDGTAVLTGFYVANIFEKSEFLKKQRISFRSPYYISPEIALRKTLDPSSDIYSLGVVLYEILTGRPPYNAEETIAIENQHIMEPVPLLPDSHKSYQDLLDKMMEKNKETRIANGGQLLHFIKELSAKTSENKENPSLLSTLDLDFQTPERKEEKFPLDSFEADEGTPSPSPPKTPQKSKTKKPTASFDLSSLLKNNKIMIPLAGAALVIIVIVLVLNLLSGGKETPKNNEPAISPETETMFKYKFDMARKLFNNNKFQEAQKRLMEAEKIKKSPETEQLALQIAAKAAGQKDHDAFKNALQKNTVVALENYLKQYPSGLHTQEAEDKITLVKEEEKTRAMELQKLLEGSIKLRTTPANVSKDEIKTILLKYNFFEKYYNKDGNFRNKFKLLHINKEPVIIDFATGLMWHQSGSEEELSAIKAKEWIAAFNEKGYAGFKDWRIPTLEEAFSLLKPTENRYSLFIDELFAYDQRSLWTTDNFQDNRVWAIDLFSGDVNMLESHLYANIRPVRSLK